MNRYALFSGDHYYPLGGWGDFKGSYHTINDARAALPQYRDWYQIVDMATGQIVESNPA